MRAVAGDYETPDHAMKTGWVHKAAKVESLVNQRKPAIWPRVALIIRAGDPHSQGKDEENRSAAHRFLHSRVSQHVG